MSGYTVIRRKPELGDQKQYMGQYDSCGDYLFSHPGDTDFRISTYRSSGGAYKALVAYDKDNKGYVSMISREKLVCEIRCELIISRLLKL